MASLQLKQTANCEYEHKAGPRKATHEVIDKDGNVVQKACRAHATAALENAQAIEDAKDRPKLPEGDAKAESPEWGAGRGERRPVNGSGWSGLAGWGLGRGMTGTSPASPPLLPLG